MHSETMGESHVLTDNAPDNITVCKLSDAIRRIDEKVTAVPDKPVGRVQVDRIRIYRRLATIGIGST